MNDCVNDCVNDLSHFSSPDSSDSCIFKVPISVLKCEVEEATKNMYAFLGKEDSTTAVFSSQRKSTHIRVELGGGVNINSRI